MFLQKNKIQTGRSMIEMLGVLAIVGVLSVGGIAGYSKAMTKIHINQTIQQISHIAIGIQTLYKNQKVIDNITPDVLKKAQIVDANIDASSFNDSVFVGTRLYTPMGSAMYVYSELTGKRYDIALHSLSEEACIALAGYDWTTLDGFDGLIFADNKGGDRIKAYAKPSGTQNRVPLSIDIVSQGCSGENNRLFLQFNLL